jgi:hypothetical protein
MNIPAPIQIERIKRISQAEFVRDYEAMSRPVIIEDQVSWDALEVFTPEWFKENLGDLRFNAVVKLPTEGAPGFQYVDSALKNVSLAEFVDMMLEGADPCYIRQSNVSNFPGCEGYFDFNDIVPLDGLSSVPNLWLGSNNTKSSLHFDQNSSLFVQAHGRKRVKLFSPDDAGNLYPFPDNIGTSRIDPYNPDLENHPRFAQAQCYEGVIGPGDFLLIPKTWWHQLTSLDPSISINCFYGEKSSAFKLLKVINAGGLRSWWCVIRDFFWLGLCGREYRTKLLAETPTGKYFYELMVGTIKRRLGLST